MLTQIETERLRGEVLRPGHEPEMSALLQDPRVGRTLWPHRAPPGEDEIRTSIKASATHWEIHGFGIWLLRDRRTGAFAGRGGLEYVHVAGERVVQAAWALVPEEWGKGLATELARCAVAAGFGELALTEIVAFTLPDNLASRRVMEKAGFSYERDIEYAGLPHVLYRQNVARRVDQPHEGSKGVRRTHCYAHSSRPL